jgi:hypothetical protein
MSMFASLGAARERWKDIEQFALARDQPVGAGYFIAELVLRPEDPFELEDLREVDEHLIVWGDPDALATAVAAVYPAKISGE